MPANDQQLQRLLDGTAANEQSTSPSDHMTVGTETQAAPAGSNDWLSYVKNIADLRAKNAYVMLNLSPEGTPRSSSISCVLNPTGMPNKVLYTFLPAGSYIPWTKDEAREVKQVVLHSFGHPWHAFQDGTAWYGYMNEGGTVEPMPYLDKSVEKVAWVPRDSDWTTMAHAGRLGTTMRALAVSAEGTAGTHFMIDRNGILYVMCDCNHILNSSGALSETCVSIALEEALYADSKSDGTYPFPFTWDPAGTSTLKAWDYSPEQWMTLSALLQKLRLAYPNLSTSTHSSSANSVGASFVGYTMHGHLSDARPQDIDVYPHLQTEDDWSALFSAVSQQGALAAYPVWKRPSEGASARTEWVEELLEASVSSNFGYNPWTSINPTMTVLTGTYRAHQSVMKTSKDYRRQAASAARNDSKLQDARLGMGRVIESELKSTPNTTSTTQVYDGQDYDVSQERRTAVARDGIL
jgi:hypothetical protein